MGRRRWKEVIWYKGFGRVANKRYPWFLHERNPGMHGSIHSICPRPWRLVHRIGWAQLGQNLAVSGRSSPHSAQVRNETRAELSTFFFSRVIPVVLNVLWRIVAASKRKAATRNR